MEESTANGLKQERRRRKRITQIRRGILSIFVIWFVFSVGICTSLLIKVHTLEEKMNYLLDNFTVSGKMEEESKQTPGEDGESAYFDLEGGIVFILPGGAVHEIDLEKKTITLMFSPGNEENEHVLYTYNLAPDVLVQMWDENIEHWTDAYTAITYWDVYYPNYVEHWNNEDGVEHLVSTERSVGLPIHYHNFNDEDYNFGLSMLADIKPIMDDLEDIMSKLGDAIYVNTLNPMPVATGQRIESSIPADATGYVLNLDVGDFKYANCNVDYNTIKLYLDNMKQFLNDVASIPSVLGSNTSIANISEVSMQILLMMANLNADETKKWLNLGFKERFKRFQKILSMQGISAESDVDVIYNVSMPVASTEMIANLKALQEMGAISRETIMEKSEIITDVDVEKKRLEGEEKVTQNLVEGSDNKINPSNKVGNE